MWEALQRAVQRGVKVILALGIAYDTGTHGRLYIEQLLDWQLDYQLAIGNPQALLGEAITHVAIHKLPPFDRAGLADQLEESGTAFAAIEARTLGSVGPVSTVSEQLQQAVKAVRDGTQMQAIQALSRVARIVEAKAVWPDLAGADAYVNDPVRRVQVDTLRKLVNQPAVRQRMYLLTSRLGGMADSNKYRGPRELQRGEAEQIQQLGVTIIHRPMVVVNTELRADRGETNPETNACSDRSVFGEIFSEVAAAAGLEATATLLLPALGVLAMEDYVRQFEHVPSRASDGAPFIIVGAQTDDQDRPGLAYGMVLAGMGFRVGFIADTPAQEQTLLDFAAESGLIAPWQLVRIDHETIVTSQQAIAELQGRATQRRINAEDPVTLGVGVPITESLARWLEAQLRIALAGLESRRIDWMVTQGSSFFA